MKVLVNRELFIHRTGDYSDSEWEVCCQEIRAILQPCSVYASYLKDVIKIEVQKITLDEYDMNNIFHNVFIFAENFNIRYAALGGNGCDFSIVIE